LLKGYATRYLMEIPPGHPAQVKGYQLRRFLDLFVSVGSEHVPPTSILREFIGGSGFSYS
jgi:uridine kinase